MAVAIFIVIAAALAYRLAGNTLLTAALVPRGEFSAAAAGAPYDYGLPASWAARPGMAGDPTAWRPTGAAPREPASEPTTAAVFFVPPTAALGNDRWNDRSDDPGIGKRLNGFLRTEASALADAGPVWAPHYRQAVLGSFLANAPDTRRKAAAAQDLAYADVAAAFAAFLAAQPGNGPIILAGHSQGALHLLRLLKQQVAGTAVAGRVAAVYLVGWPISITADLPALGLPACTRPDQAGCILSWQSFAEPADPEAILSVYYAGTGLAGLPRRGTAMLCTNPLTGRAAKAAGAGAGAGAGANPGSLLPNAALDAGDVISPGVPARCDARGLLLIGEAPSGYPAFVLPGNNYHMFDYPLFWQAVRKDVAVRVQAWKPAR